MLQSKHFRRFFAWASYNWASDAFPIIITTFVFSTYFTTQVAKNNIVGTYQWATTTAIAGVIVAIFSPIFGAIADHGGRQKWWLFIFSALCIFFTALLWFVRPTPSDVTFALICVGLGTIFLEIGVVFYNAFLPHIAPPAYLGRISGWGWGAGYAGGILSLSIVLFIFIKGQPSWLNTATAEQVRIAGPVTAIWFAIFSLPFFLFLPDMPATGLTPREAIKTGLKELFHTLKSLPHYQNLMLYLLAHLIYVDGLNTLFAFGGIYAAGTFGMSLSDVIFFGIAMNIAAGIGAILLAWADDYFGSRWTILLSLFCLTCLGLTLIFIHDVHYFWIFSLLLALFLGPVQAASRSLMARLTPINKATEFFGLYAFSGRITAFVGPWLLGVVTYLFNSQRAGMATIMIFFITGGLLMWWVKEDFQPIE